MSAYWFSNKNDVKLLLVGTDWNANLYNELIWHLIYTHNTAQKIKFSIKHFFSKCDQIRSFFYWRDP